jgi:hypothetical protein
VFRRGRTPPLLFKVIEYDHIPKQTNETRS